MRTQFISLTRLAELEANCAYAPFTESDKLTAVLDECSFTPFCIEEVDGGYRCFESEDDYDVWCNQC